MIKDNILEVRENIARAAASAGRAPSEVKLIAVSKTVGAAEVREAYDFGQRAFAENRVQKLLEKFEGLPDIKNDIDWHLIGQLQTNKIKYCASAVSLIHSIDRIGLAEALSNYAAKNDFIVHGLLEVNVSGESSKTGLPLEDVPAFLEAFLMLPNLKNIRLDGLMTMAPFEASECDLHRIFASARELAEKIKCQNVPNAPMGELSMGMSGDYEIAVAEGATICRVGTAIWKD